MKTLCTRTIKNELINFITFNTFTVEPVLKDHPIGHKNVVSRQVVSGDRFIHIEM